METDGVDVSDSNIVETNKNLGPFGNNDNPSSQQVRA